MKKERFDSLEITTFADALCIEVLGIRTFTINAFFVGDEKVNFGQFLCHQNSHWKKSEKFPGDSSKTTFALICIFTPFFSSFPLSLGHFSHWWKKFQIIVGKMSRKKLKASFQIPSSFSVFTTTIVNYIASKFFGKDFLLGGLVTL